MPDQSVAQVIKQLRTMAAAENVTYDSDRLDIHSIERKRADARQRRDTLQQAADLLAALPSPDGGALAQRIPCLCGPERFRGGCVGSESLVLGRRCRLQTDARPESGGGVAASGLNPDGGNAGGMEQSPPTTVPAPDGGARQAIRLMLDANHDTDSNTCDDCDRGHALCAYHRLISDIEDVLAALPPAAPLTERPATCAICRVQGIGGGGHWAWHDFCQCELNPIALIQWIDCLPSTPDIQRLRNYVTAVTGLTEQAPDGRTWTRQERT